MMKCPVWLASALIMLPLWVFSQGRQCGSTSYTEHLLKADPAIAARMASIESATQLTAKRLRIGAAQEERIIIPVVVHIIYRTVEENIPDAQVLAQIRVLNQDFQRENPDAYLTDPQFQPFAADTRIGFELARLDPYGRPTQGITRTLTARPEFFMLNNGVKFSRSGGVDAWNPQQYLNIWVCNLGGGMLGYAQFPGGPVETDGVVISYKHFGLSSHMAPPYNQGRTTTHEVGHWLNLRHIWGDGPCGVDDFVEDTPPSDRETIGCNGGREACGGPVMYQNFMDYTDDACMNLFTHGQAARMRALFLPGGVRQSLLSSPALGGGAQPLAVDAANLTESSVVFSWNDVSGDKGYTGWFRRQGASDWGQPRLIRQAHIRIGGLAPCTHYEFRVAPAGASPNDLGSVFAFTTQGCENPGSTQRLQAPADIRCVPAGPGAYALSWPALPGATGYKLQIKESGSKNIRSVILTENHFEVENLQPGVRYFYRIRGQFGSEAGPFSEAGILDVSAGSGARYGNAPAVPFEATRTPEGEIRIRVPFSEQGPLVVSILSPQGRTMWENDQFAARPGETVVLPFRNAMPSLRVRVSDDQGFSFEQKL